jgi:Vacuolar sorting-associated protein 13, N-terminal
MQVTINDIHLRYEDRVTLPGSLFSLGFTLSSLKLMTTDGKGMPGDKLNQSISNKVKNVYVIFCNYTNYNSTLTAIRD